MENSGPAYNRMNKLVIVGDSGVGKSSLMIMFTSGRFAGSYKSTIGTDFAVKSIQVDDQLVKLQIWDTAGQERFRTISQAFYRGTDGVVLIYDCSDESSFKNIENWIADIDKNSGKETAKVLVGNKCDLNSRVISTERGEALAKSLGIKFFETSVKENIQVEEPFKWLAQELSRRASQEAGNGIIPLSQPNPPPKKKTCC